MSHSKTEESTKTWLPIMMSVQQIPNTSWDDNTNCLKQDKIVPAWPWLGSPISKASIVFVPLSMSLKQN